MTTVGLDAITVLVTDVVDVVVTDAEQDEEGYWVREIRVFGEPAEGSVVNPQVAALRIRSLTKGNLDLTAPEQVY